MNKHQIIRISAIGLFAIASIGVLFTGLNISSPLSTNQQSAWFSEDQGEHELLLTNSFDCKLESLQNEEYQFDESGNLSVSVGTCNINIDDKPDDDLVYVLNSNSDCNDENTRITIESFLEVGPTALNRLQLRLLNK